jgi:replicative DNA helicase
MQRPVLSPEEWQRITLASAEIEDIRPALHVFDEPTQTVDDIAAQTKALAERSVVTDGVPLGLVVVDYVQNLKPPPHLERRPQLEQIRYSTVRLKALAAELKLPVIELAQEKNREVDKAKGCRPRPALGDAADCFQIERSANNVVYLWRPRERDGRHVKAVCVKQRGGDEWELDFRFAKEIARFDDLPHGPMTSPARQYIDDPEEDS